MYERNRESIRNADGIMYMDKFEDDVTPTQIETEYKEAVDIFPALHKYKENHNITNLQKLCVEIAEFCRAVYASTTSPQERQIFFDMLDKLKKT